LIGSFFVLVLALLVVLWLLLQRRRVDYWRTINVNGLERRYLVRSSDPGARQHPLLLCFHGGGGRVELLAQRMGVAESGQRQGCMVVFPEAKDGWIDARPERGGSTRDLDFVDALLDSLVSSNRIDPSRVFAFGISNGGLFVFRLACERPNRFAGVATALANMPVAALGSRSGPPVPIAMIFGDRDRVMPWAGGHILRGPEIGVGGEVVSARETVRFWLRRNYAEQTPQLRRVVSADHPVEVEDYASAPNGAPVRCVTVGNWGHRWPRWGGALSASSDIFNAADLVMEFFSGLDSSDRNAQTFSAAAGERNASA
jgi:polyhydroxybutyrate depolymerase